MTRPAYLSAEAEAFIWGTPPTPEERAELDAPEETPGDAGLVHRVDLHEEEIIEARCYVTVHVVDCLTCGRELGVRRSRADARDLAATHGEVDR